MLRKVGMFGALSVICITLFCLGSVHAEDEAPKHLYPLGKLKPRDSETHLAIGDRAPDFTLPAVDGSNISLRHYLGKKNVVLFLSKPEALRGRGRNLDSTRQRRGKGTNARVERHL
jgi:hypothetical protein